MLGFDKIFSRPRRPTTTRLVESLIVSRLLIVRNRRASTAVRLLVLLSCPNSPGEIAYPGGGCAGMQTTLTAGGLGVLAFPRKLEGKDTCYLRSVKASGMSSRIGFLATALLVLFACLLVECAATKDNINCTRGHAADIVFLIDGNLNQGPSSLEQIQTFLSNIAVSLDLNLKSSRMSVFT